MTDLLAFFLKPINFNFADFVLGVMGLFIVLICIYQAIEMHNGDRLCRFLKYVTTCAVGALSIAFAFAGLTMPAMLISTAALALFLWPTVIYFYRGEYRNRVNDK